MSQDHLMKQIDDLQRKIADLEHRHSQLPSEETEYRESERFFRAVYENSLDAILLTSGTGRILRANPAAVKMFGLETEEELMALGRGGIVDSDDPRFRDLLEQRRHTGRFSGEFTCTRKDGSKFTVEATNATFHNTAGERRTSLICRDVSSRKKTEDALEGLRMNLESLVRERTAQLKSANESLQKEIQERKHAEEALRESEESFRTIFEGARDGILVIDPQTRNAIHANKSMCELTGYPLSELLKISVDDIHPADSLERVLSEFNSMVKGEMIVAEDVPVLRKDGTVVYCDVSSGFSRFQSKELFLGFFREIGDRKKREDALRKERSRFRTLAENAPFGMAMIAADGRFTYINNNFRALFGYELNEIPTGRDWFRKAYPDPQYRHQVIAAWIEDLGSFGPGEQCPRIFTVRSKNGQDKIIHFRSVRFETGEHLMTCADITERWQAVEQLRESEEKFRLVSEQSLMSVAILQHGIYQYVNEAMSLLLEYPVEEILAWEPEEFIKAVHSDDCEFVLEQARKKQKGDPDQQMAYTFRVITKANTIKWVEIYSKTVQFKGHPANLITMLDITDRRVAEEELQKLAAVVRNSGELVNLATLDGQMVFLNESGSRMLGIEPSEVRDHRITDVIPEYQREVVECELLPALLAGTTWEGELRYLNVRTGTHTDVQALCFTVNDPNTGDPVLLANVSRDITERKESEDKLRASHDRFMTVMDSLGTTVYVVDMETDEVLFINGRAREVFGNIEGELCWKAIQEGGSARCEYCTNAELIDSNGLPTRIHVAETFNRKAGGWIEIRTRAIRWIDGRMVRVVISTEMNARKHAEQQIKLNEARLRSLYDISQYRAESIQDLLDFTLNEALKLTGSKVGYIYRYDEEAQVFELNTWSKDVMKQCEVAKPQTRYELAKTGIWGEAVRQRKPIVVNDFNAHNLLKKGYPEGHVALHNFMTVPIFSEDRIVAVIGAANKSEDYDENDVRQLAVLMDSVLRVADGKRLELIQRRLVTALEHLAEGIMVTDVDGTIEYVNPALAKMTGYDKDELLNENARIFKSGEHDAEVYNDLWRTIASGEVWEGRLVNRKKDGSHYTEDITISPVRDSSGVVTDFVAVKRDITEHLALSKQLSHSQKMEAIGTLAGGIAHDFNNLLMIIVGYADLLVQHKQSDDRERAKLEAIRKAAKDGAELVNQILTFSKRVESKVRPIDLNEEIRRIERLMTRMIPKMIHIELALEKDLSIINADPAQMEQIILNLAVNAHHAMPEGGRLIIETTNVTLREDYCKLHPDAQEGHHVCLSLSDTGAGIEPGIVDRIFEPFFTTKEGAQGTGLGLSMVHGIVAQHRGHIRCFSEPGIGTTFKIYFPAVKSQVSDDVSVTSEMPAFGTETILLVDDDIRIRDLTGEMLMMSGYDVVLASNGQQALDIYRERGDRIALVILDLIMPSMSGNQCLKELLEIDPEVRVVISSGYSGTGSTNEPTVAGARDFVTKPYDMREILKVIRRTIDADH